MLNDESVPQWRRDQRTRLLARRIAAGKTRRRLWSAAIDASLRSLLPAPQDTIIAVYWPFKGEFDTRSLMREVHAQGARPALPAVIGPKAPLAFRPWHPEADMVPGVYKIPVPKTDHTVVPAVVIAPLTGFDAAGYRLGYGGGYYDRTLAVLRPRPFIIGVGFELSRLETIYPQPHDIPMDVIVTEAGVFSNR